MQQRHDTVNPPSCTLQERRNKLLRRLEKLDMQQRRLERHLSDAAAIAAVANTAPRPRAVVAHERGPGLSGGACPCLQPRHPLHADPACQWVSSFLRVRCSRICCLVVPTVFFLNPRRHGKGNHVGTQFLSLTA